MVWESTCFPRFYQASSFYARRSPIEVCSPKRRHQTGSKRLPTIQFLRPLDQPTGNGRTLAWLATALGSSEFSRLRLVAAFAKVGPLSRIAAEIANFRANGGNIQAVFGIDLMGTSLQALTFALSSFDESFIWHHPSPFTTFHPKIYICEGTRRAEIQIGSNNLTVGGMETNCESAIRAAYVLPQEAEEWTHALDCWVQLIRHPNTIPLTSDVITSLHADGLLSDETQVRPPTQPRVTRRAGRTSPSLFPFTPLAPPSSLLPTLRRRAGARRPATRRRTSQAEGSRVADAPGSPNALVIQIVPHHNGEIFLSKIAINQHPDFFGFPFTGQTIPKRSGNPPYPQRVPDPVTEWRIYNRRGRVVRSLTSYGLNTVFYERKGEIRITVPPEFARLIPSRSILVMARPSPPSMLDYICDVFPPGNAQYASLSGSCNQIMPSGGSGAPRRFGWV